jgi:hypothetical protein
MGASNHKTGVNTAMLSKVGEQTGMNLLYSLTFLLKSEKLFTLQI